MTPDNDLPAWTIRPNWRDGVLERLEWLTSIEASGVGAEQAIAYRLSPRRTFEALFNPVGDVRSYFDLWLHRFGAFEFMLPLWHDTGRLSDAVVAGATTIPVDTTFREFVVGGSALLVGETPHDFDRVTITAVADAALTVEAAGLTRDWPLGTKINPLRRARLSDQSQVSALTNRVGEGSIQFELNQANDIPDAGDWEMIYDGLPVLLIKPNYRDRIDMNFTHNRDVIDNMQGLRELGDEAERAFTLQSHSFMFNGRADHWAFRQMLYRLGGRQGALWVPTFNQDLILSRARLAADDFLDIRKIGYEYTGGVKNGRSHVLIGNGVAVEIDDVEIPLTNAEERLSLTAALGSNFDVGAIGSFMDTCHLASDAVEIAHHTDTDGAGECDLSWQSFLNDRTDPDPVYYPIAEAVMSDEPCSAPDYPPLPVIFRANVPEPVPLLDGSGGMSLAFIVTVLLPDFTKAAALVGCGARKIVTTQVYDLSTDTAGAVIDEVDDGINVGGEDFVVNFNVAFGEYETTGIYQLQSGVLSCRINAIEGVDLRVVTDQWQGIDDWTNPVVEPGPSFIGSQHAATFFIESDDDLHATYSAFNFNPEIVAGPSFELVSTPVQAWWQIVGYPQTKYNEYVAWGLGDPAAPFAPVVDTP